MSKLLVGIYNLFPRKVRRFFGGIKFFKIIRDLFLVKNGQYREVAVEVNRSYEKYYANFTFFASVKSAAQAIKDGIENVTVINGIRLLNKHKPDKNDYQIIDVGANFGYLTLAWANTICKPNGKIHAFEANTAVYESLYKSVLANNLKEHIQIENLAVGGENKQVKLYLDATTSNIEPIFEKVNSTQIEMTTIDTYVEKNKINGCDLIKIDIDGLEMDVLEGCLKTIDRFRPVFIVESNNNRDLITFFNELDYKILDLNLKEFNSQGNLPLNIHCVPL